ncbi:glycoside hydrolase family 5 protein [Rubripirellula reticaptiva]|nr:glycoside hydrolase family 5 protein [Rubripirellula reticaptiva]
MMFSVLRLNVLLTLLWLPVPVFAETATSLLSNSNFELGTAEKPQDWPTPDGVTWLEEDGNHFLRFSASIDKMLTVYREVRINPEYEALQLSFRVRVNSLQRGKANWHDGRIILDFKDADGNKLKGATHPSFSGTTDGWTRRSVEMLVPKGAVKLEVMPAMFQAKSGSYDLDDVKLSAIDSAPLIAKREADAIKENAEIARRAALVQPSVSKASAEQLPLRLHVQGNKILDAKGSEVWLQGVSLPSMEWSAGGENILKSVHVAIEDWNANSIRLCIRENFWSGTGPYQRDGGAGYRQLVDDVVNLAGSHGVYVILDLHRFRAPEPQHAVFWKELATLYKDHPAVLFELFNEPHDLTWQVWRDGGFVSNEKKSDSTAVAENKEELKGFESIGMQALVDAVRKTGAKNIVIAGGLDWSYDLSGILTGFALNDRNGHGIVYSTHVYPWKSDWRDKFMDVAKRHPIFIGECGATQERLDFIPPEQHEDPATWVPDFIGVVQQHRYHWTAWSFHPKSSPCLLSDWDYTPTPYWGEPAKRALLGEQFPVGELR